MRGDAARSTLAALGWLAFPLLPALLALSYHHASATADPDPRRWGAWDWVLGPGPLWGFGFLAGATAILPDDPTRRGWRTLPARRALWVAVGPWSGYLAVLALGWARGLVGRHADGEGFGLPPDWLLIGMVAVAAHGWVVVAAAALVRAWRRGRLLGAIGRGLATALGFVGSLVGGFWAATAAWRSYFFDPTVLGTALLAVLGVTLLGGCAGPMTLGELRRRDLYEKMVLAWVVGLAMLWLWWSRPRPRR